MHFIVLNREKIEKFTTTSKHVVISIRDPEKPIVYIPDSPNRYATIFLAFHDIDKPTPDLKLMSEGQAETIVNLFTFYRNKIDEVIINCEAGISRSSAVAGALARINGQEDNKFFKYYIPNKYVYNLILKEYYENSDNR